MKRVLLGALVATTMVSAAYADDLDICVEGAYPPFSMIDENGKLIGMDIDITFALCEEMGHSCSLVKTDWDAIIPSLLANKCDAIIASMSITEERKKLVDFSAKYANSPSFFIAKEGAGFEDTVDGLAGKRIGVQRGTVQNDLLDDVFTKSEIVLYNTEEDVFLDLASGRIDASFGDGGTGEVGFLKTPKGEGFAFFGKAYNDIKYFGEGVGVAVRKEDTALRDAFSAAILSIRDNGKYMTINNKYFTKDQYGD